MQKNLSLKKYNTFGIDVRTKWFDIIESEEQLLTIIDDLPDMRKLILGSGSNVLFLNDFDGIVLLNQIKGKRIVTETDDSITLAVKGGENWHDLVMWAVENNYAGIENLALIPGKVGTAPIQNIGAYGVEIKDVIQKVHTINMTTCEHRVFEAGDCEFSYRHSIFKKPENKGRYFINQIEIKLQKNNHKLHLEYGAIKQFMAQNNIKSPTAKDVAESVMSIRRSKLPDPKQTGNAGSFFKNPVVDKVLFERLHNSYPDMPYYKLTEVQYKIPAGWLIEQAGFKGKRFGNAGVHNRQALVLVNFGGATGQEIKDLADMIIETITEKFGIDLQPEVNYIQ